jgi:predicted NUDIX family phosphoesterase
MTQTGPEQVMVVERHVLEPFIVERGLVQDGYDDIFDRIVDTHFFIDRPTAEISPQYKQIIPYVVIRNGQSYFLLQRTQKQTEARLHHKLSLGIGGHINPDTPDLLDGLQKELDEEVTIASDYDLTFMGILNDDTTDVGRVHLGVVYLLDAHAANVTVRETEKMTGRWAGRAELELLRQQMESWSEIVFDALIDRSTRAMKDQR